MTANGKRTSVRALALGAVCAVGGGLLLAAEPAGTAATQAAAPAALRVKVMTFNACGDHAHKTTWTYDAHSKEVVCSSTGNTAKMAHGIDGYMKAGGMFGDASTTHVLFLQEVCWADVKRLKTYQNIKGHHWTFRFKAVRDRGTPKKRVAEHNRQCRSGRGGFGIAVGVDHPATFQKYMFTAYPKGNDGYGHVAVKQPLICGTTTASKLRFCGAHLTPGSNHSAVRLAQGKGLVQRAGTGARVIVGGDFNAHPTSAELKPLYSHYQECDQAAHGTFQKKGMPGKDRLTKLDYVFTGKNAVADGSVTANHVSISDHRPLIANLVFP